MTLKKGWKLLSEIGLHPGLSTYEQGLVKLTNKAAVLVFGVVNILLLPMAVFSQYTAPILFINSIFYPLTLYFNHRRQFQVARHFLLGLLYCMLLLVMVFRGLDSGILFITIPALLLAYIFFPKQQALYVHLCLLASYLLFAFVYTNLVPPLAPYASGALRLILPLHLAISLTLTFSFINFFLKVNREYQRELMELNTTKARLFSIIGHDLKGPLNSLNGVLGLLNNKYMSQEEFYQLSGKLQQSTHTLHTTLTNLLHWSLTQLKGMTATPSQVQLQANLAALLPLYVEDARQKEVQLEIAIPAEHQLYCDPNHLALVLRNLISNALKYTPEGGRILLRSEEKEAEMIIAVTDTGIGLSEKALQALFAKNMQQSQKGTKGESGTGLGLLLCQEMLQLNGGRMWAQSSPGMGSTFYVSLPRQAPAAKGL